MAQTDKYDRQLRIWGKVGQKHLMESTVLLLGCTAYGAETLKNIVLPGIGEIVIVSNKKCTYRDMGSNFYMKPGCVEAGRNLAEEVSETLVEINPDVKGRFIDADPETFLETHQAEINAASFIMTDN
jgi:amyloid beta precursor protein binding protein 1